MMILAFMPRYERIMPRLSDYRRHAAIYLLARHTCASTLATPR